MHDAAIVACVERRYVCPSCGMKWFTLRHMPDWDKTCGRCGTGLVALIAPPPGSEPGAPPPAPAPGA